MNTKFLKRLFSLLLCCLLVIGLFPTHAHAWDNECYCEFCGEFCGDDYICSGGDHCSEESGRSCYEENHCQECGECRDNEWCDDCHMHINCAMDNACHCANCGECFVDVTKCEGCDYCSDCAPDWCDECEMCFSCAVEAGKHCPDCGECTANEGCQICHRCFDCGGQCGDSCDDACLICHLENNAACEGCGACFVGDDASYCQECHLCGDCAGSEICEDCKMCIECAKANECHCPECGDCFVEHPPCPGGCGLCGECVEEWCSECGMCVECAKEDGKHCPDCGECTASEGCVVCHRCFDCGGQCGDSCEDCCLICHLEYNAACEGCGACFVGEDASYCQECNLCGDCAGSEICEDCKMCIECAKANECHCPDCGDCFVEHPPCPGGCGLCGECVDEWCSECGMCVECAKEDGKHCPDCGECTANEGCQICHRCFDCGGQCGDSCDDACLICHLENNAACEGCGACFVGEDASYCQECNLCGDCAGSEICEDCKMCIECAKANECHCPDCGSCFVEYNPCPECGLCTECVEWCEECGMCTTCAADYGWHCPGCQNCLEDVEYCEGCDHCSDCADICPDCGSSCSECAVVCESCGSCENCADICESCGLCENCVDICGGCGDYCSDCVVICPDCGSACSECAVVCEDCGVCENCADICESCGLCENCVDICGGCGDYCSDCVVICPDCGSACSECAVVCEDCGTCENCADICESCGRCENCVDICDGCGDYCEDCATICPDCGSACSECVVVCEDCGTCSDCADICEDCGLCEYCTTICQNCREHCADCVILCEGCDTCENCADVCMNCYQICSECGTICPDCGLCEECCEANSIAAGCSHGTCVMSSGWDAHWSAEHEGQEHVHVYGWHSDADGHWQICKITSCGDTTEKQPHTYGEWVIEPATCTSTGTKERTCSACSYKETVILPITHGSYEWKWDETNHWKQCTVSGCGAVISGSEAAHDFGDDYICDICGYDKTTDYAVVEGNNSSWETDASTELTFKADGDISKFVGVKIDGSFIDSGSYTVSSGSTIIRLKPEYLATLSVGLHKITVVYTNGEASAFFRITQKANEEHKHTLTLVPAKAESCTEDGNIAYYTCSCGKMFTTKTGTSEIINLSSVVIPATGHNYKWVIDKAATETEDGSKHEECTICHHKKDFVVIPSVGYGHVHNYDAAIVAPTCTDWGYTEYVCSCGNSYRGTYVKPSGHADANKNGFCDVCGEKLKTSSGGDRGIVIPTYYDITVEDAAHGEVASNRKTASSGTTVTLTVEADKGYTLETLTVTNKRGDEIALTNKGNGEYTFKMPASDVTVEATFMEDNTMLNYFVDVPADAYYYDAVLWAVENEITNGTDAVHFSPDMTCTRAQAVTFLWRAAGSPEPETDVMPFEDVTAGSYYYDAVLWAVENGITIGTSATTFSPNADCTRAQIVTFLWRAQKSPAADAVNPFSDVAADAYYVDAVLWAVKEEATKGTSATTFSPDADCTRAQIVTFLYRALADK